MNTMNFKTVMFFLTLTIISFTNSVTIKQNQNSFVEESSEQQCKKVGGVDAIINRTLVDGWKDYYMIDNVNRIQAETKINKWTIFAKRTKPVQLVIYRKSGTKFTVVGKSALENPSMGANTFLLNKPIEAKEGDYIGWYFPQRGVIAYTLHKGGKWVVNNLSHSTLFTHHQRKSATAFQYSSPRTYSINVLECDSGIFRCGIVGGSDATKSRPHVDGARNYYMIDSVNRVNRKATIFEFKIFAKRLKPVQVIIYRKVGSKFTVVGKSLMETPKKLGLNRFDINHTIDVLPGDYVGWYVPQNGVIAFTLNVRGRWLVKNLSQSTLFTGQRKSVNAFHYSSPRTYSVEVIGC
jgi:hypothetical protein